MKNARLVFGAILGIMSFGLAGCAADELNLGVPNGGVTSEDRTANKIVGSVEEWQVRTSANSAVEGDVLFSIANFGTIPHEFLVVKTDFEPGKIPLGADNRFDEEADGLSVVDEIPEWEPNTAGVLKLNLKPGAYQLLCNIAGHYKNGMYKAFNVLPSEKPVTIGSLPEQAVPAKSETPSNDITGSVSEWQVSVDAHESTAGDVSFTMTNKGTIAHEFLVVKTDYEPGKIPLGTNNRFDEEAEGLTVVDEIPEWEPGKTGTLKLKLEAGTYQLLCNIAGHYKNGMYAPLIVSK
jgi:uncharacterized cupredoxin-like copper-binding protein